MTSASQSCARVRAGAAELELAPSGALWSAKDRVLVMADLHLEKGSSYAARGQLIPPYDTVVTLERLEAEVAAFAPEQLIFLGDSFHDRHGPARLLAEYQDRLARLARLCDLVWVAGNHDSEGLDGLPGRTCAEIASPDLIFRHAAEPCGDVEGRVEVSGHYHPCAKVSSRGRGVRRRCFALDGDRLILPAFGAYTGGLNILDPAFAAVLRQPVQVFALGRDAVIALDPKALRPD